MRPAAREEIEATRKKLADKRGIEYKAISWPPARFQARLPPRGRAPPKGGATPARANANVGVTGAMHGWADFQDLDDDVLDGAGRHITSMAVVAGAGEGVPETAEGGVATLDPFVAGLCDFASEEFATAPDGGAAEAVGFYARCHPVPGEGSYVGATMPEADTVENAYEQPADTPAAVDAPADALGVQMGDPTAEHAAAEPLAASVAQVFAAGMETGQAAGCEEVMAHAAAKVHYGSPKEAHSIVPWCVVFYADGSAKAMTGPEFAHGVSGGEGPGGPVPGVAAVLKFGS